MSTTMSSQNHTTNTNTAKTSTRKLVKVNPPSNNIGILPDYRPTQTRHATCSGIGKRRGSLLAPRIAHRFRDLRCLRGPADLRSIDRRPAAPARERPHALVGGLASGRIWVKLCRAAQGKRPPSRLHMSRPGRQLLDAAELLVHTLERGGEDLLAVQRLVDGTGEAPAPRLGFAAALTLLLTCQRAFLVAQISQADTQRLEPVRVLIVDRGMMRETQDLILLVAEKTSLELAGYGHLRIPFGPARDAQWNGQ